MPDVRARIISGAGHLSTLDNSEDFDRVIMRFLEIAQPRARDVLLPTMEPLKSGGLMASTKVPIAR
jgi:hypothetical protein